MLDATVAINTPRLPTEL